MIFASILLILFQQSFCQLQQRLVHFDVGGIMNVMCTLNRTDVALRDHYQATIAKLDTLEKKLVNVFDMLTTVRIFIGYSQCRSGYEYFQQGKFCYKFNSACTTWSEARNVCQQEGGDLISIKQGHFQFFRNVVKQQSSTCNGAWVGATDVSSPGNWNWLNGEMIHKVFWSTDQPDNWNDAEHCADMIRFYDFYLNDENCDAKAHFLCQII